MSRKRRHHHEPPDLHGGPDKPPGEVVRPPSATPGEDVNLRAIVRFGVGLALATVCVTAFLLVYMQILSRRAAAREQASAVPAQEWEREDDQGTALRKPEGGVSLQRQPFRDIEELRRHEAERLSKYAWIDESTGTVRIPIEAAMRMVVRRGLPVRASSPLAAPAPPPAMGGAVPTPPAATPSPKPRRRPRPRPAAGTEAPAAAPPPPTAEPVAEDDRRPEPLRAIGFDQRIGQRLPLDIALRDEAGNPIVLGDLFTGRPVVLSLVYYECPMLCTLSLNGLVSALRVLKLEPGRDFDLVTVSFNERDSASGARARKKAYLERYDRPGADRAWHFLTGDKDSLARLTDAVGFRYTWDEETRQFAHGSGIVVATPDGVLSRYLYGIEYAPKDLRLALVESAAGRLGSVVDRFLLACYRYDPAHGRYGAYAMGLVRAAGGATVLTLAGFMAVMLRRERR
jgi:protein SCO1